MLKTNDGKLLDVEVLTENEIFDEINKVNPELANIILENSLAKDIPFFKANYLFGEKIIYNNDVFFPLVGGGSIAFNDPEIPDILRDSLGYTRGVNNPVGMILNKESNFYLPMDDRIVSYIIIKPGQIFGFAHIIDAVMRANSKKQKKASVSVWNLDAGARLSFILPQISENKKHTNLLQAYDINVAKPTEYINQRNVFRAINASLRNPWKQSILFIPKQFLDNLVNNIKFSVAYQEMANIHRSGYNIWHTTYAKWDSDINYVFQKANVNHLSSYAVNIAKHIFLIIAGGVTGLVPATNENMAPIELIETAYNKKDGYGLAEYWPIIMQPKQFTGKEVMYYLINLETLIHFNPETFKGKTILELTYEVITVLNKSHEFILNEFEDRDSYLYETAIKASFSCYHGEPKPEIFGNKIKNSALLPEEDPRFKKEGWTFPAHSQLLRGCIKIEPVN